MNKFKKLGFVHYKGGLKSPDPPQCSSPRLIYCFLMRLHMVKPLDTRTLIHELVPNRTVSAYRLAASLQDETIEESV